MLTNLIYILCIPPTRQRQFPDVHDFELTEGTELQAMIKWVVKFLMEAGAPYGVRPARPRSYLDFVK